MAGFKRLKDNRKMIDLLKIEAERTNHAFATYSDETINQYLNIRMSDKQATLFEAKMYVKHFMLGNVTSEELARAMVNDNQLRHTISDLCKSRLEYSPLNIERNGSYIDLKAGAMTFWSEIHAPLPSELEAAKDIRLLNIGIEAARRAGIKGYERDDLNIDGIQWQDAEQAQKKNKKSFRERMGERIGNMIQSAAQFGIDKLTPLAERKKAEEELTAEKREEYEDHFKDLSAGYVDSVAERIDDLKLKNEEKTASSEDILKAYEEAANKIYATSERYADNKTWIMDDVSGKEVLWPDISDPDYELTDDDKNMIKWANNAEERDKYIGYFKEFEGAYDDMLAGKTPSIERNPEDSDTAYQIRQEAMIAYLGVKLAQDSAPEGTEPAFDPKDLAKLSYYGAYTAGREPIKSLDDQRVTPNSEYIKDSKTGQPIYWPNLDSEDSFVSKDDRRKLGWAYDPNKLDAFMSQFKDFDKGYNGEDVQGNPYDSNTHAQLTDRAFEAYKNIRMAMEDPSASSNIDIKDAATLQFYKDYLDGREADKAEAASRQKDNLEARTAAPTMETESGYTLEELNAPLDPSIMSMLDQVKARVDAARREQKGQREQGQPKDTGKEEPEAGNGKNEPKQQPKATESPDAGIDTSISFEKRRSNILSAHGMTLKEYNEITSADSDMSAKYGEDRTKLAYDVARKIAKNMTLDEFVNLSRGGDSKGVITSASQGNENDPALTIKRSIMLEESGKLIMDSWSDKQAAERFANLTRAGYSEDDAAKVVLDAAINKNDTIRKYQDALTAGFGSENLANCRMFTYARETMEREQPNLPDRDVTNYKMQNGKVWGQMDGKPVSFKDKWGQHEFTKEEISDLLAGKAITFDTTTKDGKPYTATGTLAVQMADNGYMYIGFERNKDVDRTKVVEASTDYEDKLDRRNEQSLDEQAFAAEHGREPGEVTEMFTAEDEAAANGDFQVDDELTDEDLARLDAEASQVLPDYSDADYDAYLLSQAELAALDDDGEQQGM